MEWDTAYITLPKTGASKLLGSFLSLYGTGFLLVGLLNPGFVFLFLAVVGAVLLAAGLWLIVRSLARMHLSRDGIFVTMGTHCVFQANADTILLISEVFVQTGKQPLDLIAISGTSLEALAQIQEQELLRNPLSKYNVPIRKKNPQWQENFAREYLKKKSKWNLFSDVRQGILWLERTQELQAILKQLYPQVRWLSCEKKAVGAQPKWVDQNETVFCRGYTKAGSWKTESASYLLLLVLPFFLAAIFVEGAGIGFFGAFCMFGIYLVIWVMMGAENDEVFLLEKEIRISRGLRKYDSIPAEQIRTILRVPMPASRMWGSALLISDQTIPELAEAEVIRLEKTPEGRNLVGIWKQLPDWERYAALHSGRYHAQWGFTLFTKKIVICYTSGREETLRRLYPQAQWLVDTDVLGE